MAQIKLAQKWRRNPLTDLRQSGTLYRNASGYERSGTLITHCNGFLERTLRPIMLNSLRRNGSHFWNFFAPSGGCGHG